MIVALIDPDCCDYFSTQETCPPSMSGAKPTKYTPRSVGPFLFLGTVFMVEEALYRPLSFLYLSRLSLMHTVRAVVLVELRHYLKSV